MRAWNMYGKKGKVPISVGYIDGESEGGGGEVWGEKGKNGC